MAFVITGNAWAEGDFNLPSNITTDELSSQKFTSLEWYGNMYIYPKVNNINSSVSNNNVSMIGNIDYKNSPLIIYSGLSMGKDAGIKIENCKFIIENYNITTTYGMELAGGASVFSGAKENERIVSRNVINVKDSTLTSKNSYIQIMGGFANPNSLNALVANNTTTLEGKSSFNSSVVEIYGGYAISGSAFKNTVTVKDNIELSDSVVVYGGYGGYSGSKLGTVGYKDKCESGITIGNADENIVNIEGNSIINGTVYGGYSKHGTANNNTINIKENANVSNASLFGDKDGAGELNTLNIDRGWVGTIGSAKNFDFIYMYEGSKVNFGEALEAPEVILKGATWNVTQKGNKVGTLNNNNGKIVFNNDGHLDVNKVGSGEVVVTEAGKTADDFNNAAQLTTVAAKMGVSESAKESAKAKVVMEAGEVVGKTTGIVEFKTKGSGEDAYYHGVVTKVTEEINPANEAISDTGVSMKLHWRAHVDDMNKRMGELRDANGEYGVWTRMVRGESEYKNTKAQYNQYQLGYDEKLSVDKRWTVGAAVTFSDGKASYGYGSTEDKSTAFAIYGTKLNNDGTFVDLIARYAHLESDVEDQAGKGSYSANGMSVSAEVGKRIQQDNGLWIEPQVQLTYGTVDSAEYKIGTKTVEVGDMNSLIGRVGFRIGKDIEKGNVYARASYLYDFEGETQNAFRNDTARRTFAEDLGGGWWEVGVGANINLSKATYIYADVEKTFGGEVDTNWQWNLGVRYSF